MDDASVAASVDLKKCLVIDTTKKERPLTFSERTGHSLPKEHNMVQSYIEDIETFTVDNKMIINKNKTTVMKFTRARKYDFPLEICFSDNTNLEYRTKVKLLGVMVTDNLSCCTFMAFSTD